MGELKIGARIAIRLVSRVATLTSEGTTALYRGSMSTSSNVSPLAISLSFMAASSSNPCAPVENPELLRLYAALTSNQPV
jgi:hypothetical protein